MPGAARSPSEVLPEELGATRHRKGWTQRQLADRLDELGAPLDRSTIAKIEAGKRGVSIDEVFWLAAALEVSPLVLLLPRGDEPVSVAPAIQVRTWEAFQWARGVYPLGRADTTTPKSDRFFHEARPDYEAEALRRHPGVRSLWELANLAVFYSSEEEMRTSLERVLRHISIDAAAEVEKLNRDIPERI